MQYPLGFPTLKWLGQGCYPASQTIRLWMNSLPSFNHLRWSNTNKYLQLYTRLRQQARQHTTALTVYLLVPYKSYPLLVLYKSYPLLVQYKSYPLLVLYKSYPLLVPYNPILSWCSINPMYPIREYNHNMTTSRSSLSSVIYMGSIHSGSAGSFQALFSNVNC